MVQSTPGRLRREDLVTVKAGQSLLIAFSDRVVPLGVVWGMFGETVMLLSVGLAFFIVTFFLHQMSMKALFSQFESWKTEVEPPGIDEIKEDLLDLVEEVIGNMQPPNAGDHFMGMMGQIAQMWAMRKFNIDPQTGLPRPELELPDIVEDIIDRVQ